MTTPAPTPPANRAACSWCGREMRPGVEPTTHSICRGCFAAELAKLPKAVA